MTGQETTAQIKIQQAPSEHQEAIFYSEGDRAHSRFSQRSSGISFHGNIKKLPGHGPE